MLMTLFGERGVVLLGGLARAPGFSMKKLLSSLEVARAPEAKGFK